MNAHPAPELRRHLAGLIALVLLEILSLLLPDPTNDAYVYHFQDLNRRTSVEPVTPAEGKGWYTYGPYLSLPPGTVRASLDYEATDDGNKMDYSMAAGTVSSGAVPMSRWMHSKTLGYESPDAPIQNFQIRSIYGGKGTLKINQAVIQHIQNRSRRATQAILAAIVAVLAAYGFTLRKRGVAAAIADAKKPLAACTLGAATFFLLWLFRIRSLSLNPVYWEDGVVQLMACWGISCIVCIESKARTPDAARGWLVGVLFAIPFLVTATIDARTIMGVNDVSVIWRAGMQIPPFLILLETFLRKLPMDAPRAKGAVWALVCLAIAFPPIWNLVYFSVFDQSFGYDAIFGIYQTNPDQALEFLSQYVPHLVALVLAFAGIVAGLTAYGSRRIFRKASDAAEAGEGDALSDKLAAPACAILVALALAGIADSAAESPAVREYVKIDRYFKSLTDRSLDSGISVRRIEGRQGGPRTKVVVIGESAAKDHLSFYGYGRKTSPWMDSMGDEWIRFNHAYAANKFTIYALELALSEETQYNKKTFAQSLSVVEGLQRAGYKVTWLSNQKLNSDHNTPFGLIAKRANRSFWTKSAGKGFDEALLPEFRKVSPLDDNVVFLHLNGSHGLYKERYPKERRVFAKGDGNVLDEYDDTILYTDGFLKDVFEYARDNLNMDAFIYLSDHGEDPGVPRNQFRWKMMRIPLVMWFSDEYRENHRERIERLEARSDAFWGVDMLYDTLMGLFDVETDRMDPGCDLSSEGFATSAETMVVEGGKHLVKDDPAIAGN